MQGLRTCIYMVSDLDAAKAWYTKVFETAPYFDLPTYIGFNIKGYELGLQPLDIKLPKSENVYTYWGVKDIHASYNRLLELGATPPESPNDVGGDILVATVKDPWDNLLGIIYNPHFTIE